MMDLWQLWTDQSLIIQLAGFIVALAIFGCTVLLFVGGVMRVGESDHRHLERRYQRMRQAQDERDTWRIVNRVRRS